VKPRARYHFVLSLPERVLRSLSALSGGLLREIGNVLLPLRIRRTALYRVMVEVTLRFLIEEVGRVEGVYPKEGQLAQDFLLRSGASRGIELLGLLTIHVSPVWVLAALADATGAGHSLISQISDALKQDGLLDRDTRFESVDQLLDGLERTSSQLAETLNQPPLDVASLREEWSKLKKSLPRIPRANLPQAATLEQIWKRLVHDAAEQDRSVFAVCSLMAVSAVANIPANVYWLSRAAKSGAKRTGAVLGDALLGHYVRSLDEIKRTGFAEYWKREFKPYLRAAALQFAPSNRTLTERLLSRKQ
jgi:hypothetical protein